MKKRKIRMKTLVGLAAMVGLTLPMADGCHKHAQVKAAQGAAVQLAAAQTLHGH